MTPDAASVKTEPGPSPGFTVGILGGMGPAATVDFYAKLVGATPADRDQDHLRVVIWADPTVPDRGAALLEGGTDPTPWLLEGARKLEASGADLIAVPCNQAHAFLPAVAEDIGIPFVSMIEATVQCLRALPQPVTRVALLAATGTLRTGLYRSQLEEAGLELLVPTEPEQEAAMAAFRAVKAGDTGATTENCLTDVALHLVSRGADVLVAGCTEALLALSADRVTVPVIDPAQALAEKILAMSAPSMDCEHT
ncbi:MAG TPA: amino acid racemase [Kribbella sp.]